MPHTQHPVFRPSDNELVGFVRPCSMGCDALTIFGAHLATTTDETTARAYLHTHGLSVLQRPWHYYDPTTQQWHIAHIHEAAPSRVSVTLGIFPLPTAPIRVLTSTDFATGHILQLAEP